MLIAFTLTMPGVASWNGRWSGEDKLYARVVNTGRSKKGQAEAERILAQPRYPYAWEDGWRTSVAVREVDAAEARQLRRKSDGFAGYDWMIDSTRTLGKIEYRETYG